MATLDSVTMIRIRRTFTWRSYQPLTDSGATAYLLRGFVSGKHENRPDC